MQDGAPWDALLLVRRALILRVSIRLANIPGLPSRQPMVAARLIDVAVDCGYLDGKYSGFWGSGMGTRMPLLSDRKSRIRPSHAQQTSLSDSVNLCLHDLSSAAAVPTLLRRR